MNIYAKIVATLKYIERVNWCVSKGTLYCVDPLPELDDEPCYNEHYQDGPLACQVQWHVPKGALDLNDLLLTLSRRYESEGTQ